jgi:group I intron endonuclease
MDQRDLKAAGDFAQNFGCSGIYRITNIWTNDIYVGSAVNFKKRWNWHLKDLKGNRHSNSYLQNAWNKYGNDYFKFEIIECCEKEKLIEREQYWIDTLKCVRPNGYNLAPIAGNSLGIKRSAETREKQRQKKLGVKQSPEHVASRVAKLIGHKVSDAQKEALRLRSLWNTWGTGIKHTDEVKAKISATHKGKPKSEEHKRKMSENAKKQKRSFKPFDLILTSTPMMLNECK